MHGNTANVMHGQGGRAGRFVRRLANTAAGPDDPDDPGFGDDRPAAPAPVMDVAVSPKSSVIFILVMLGLGTVTLVLGTEPAGPRSTIRHTNVAPALNPRLQNIHSLAGFDEERTSAPPDGHGHSIGLSTWPSTSWREVQRELLATLHTWQSAGEISGTESSLLACSWGVHDTVDRKEGEVTEDGVDGSPSSAATISRVQNSSGAATHSGHSHIPIGQMPKQQETFPRRVNVVPYHVVFGAAEHDGYHPDGATRFVRGYNEAFPVHAENEKPDLFEEVDSLDAADAVVYHAYGDSASLQADVDRANLATIAGCKPIVFFLTTDRSYAPTVCRAHLIFFAVNASSASGCEVHAIPNQEGAAMGRVGVTLSTIQDRLVKKTAARRRPYVASFVGSMYTYPARSKMESMRSADILINATDWWLRNSTNATLAALNREDMASKAFNLAESSIFQFTPRGNGPSSMRLVETMVAGSLPVMIDDWTRPFGNSMCDFAIRWTTRPRNSRFDLLAKLLRLWAHDQVKLQARRAQMASFLQQHHPVWFDMRFVYQQLTTGDSDLCKTRLGLI